MAESLRDQREGTFGDTDPVDAQISDINKKIVVLWAELDIPPL